jgi:hypothetical protein
VTIGQRCADCDSRTESNQTGHDCPWTAIHHGRIVPWYVHDLWIRRLNDNNGLASLGFLDDLQLGAAPQSPRCISLRPQSLNRVHHRSFIGRERLSDGGIVVDVLRHHVQNLREANQRDECRVEILLLRRIR